MKVKLTMRADALGILPRIPRGMLDNPTVLQNVPDAVWTNNSFAKRWFASGGTITPNPPGRGRQIRRLHQPRELTVRIQRMAVRWGRDWASDVGSDHLEDAQGAAIDLADGLLAQEGYSDQDRKRLRHHLADDVYDGIQKGAKR